MKINVFPNLVIPGYEGRNSLEFTNEHTTLLDVLNRLSGISKGKIKFLRPEGCVSRDDFIIKLNGKELKGDKNDLEKELRDEDTIIIIFETLGG